MKNRALAILILILSTSIEAHGYELATHGRMADYAYQKFTVDNAVDFRSNLGIDIYDPDAPFGDQYFDVFRDQIELRKTTKFEEDKGRMSDPNEALTIKGWLMRGAIREDDVLAGFSDDPPPQDDDPYNTGDVILDNRPLHHFYDPRNNRGLSKQIPVVGTWVTIGEKAPDWGIGAEDAFADSNAADAWRRNHFTVFDARESMFRALTGMSGSGSKAIGAGGSEPTTAADKEAVRKAYWATTFRALGDLVHLIQDMAQPQHTRNDPHAGSDDYSQSAGPAGHKSFYEGYIEQRATQLPIVESNGNSYTPAALVYDNGYPIPRFNDYVSYFSTRNVDASVPNRKGMADYSNRGFFSAGKNLGQGDYDLPPNSISGGFYTPEQKTVNADGTTVHILKGSVSDAHASSTSTSDVPLTAFGSWSEALKQATDQESFTLIRDNYDAMADLLIPRAVAYSAGLIDYFFRGRLEITPPDEGVYALIDHAVVNGIDQGFTKVKLKLRNITTAQEEHAQEMGAGNLYAVVKFRRNPCYLPDLSSEVIEGTTISDPAYCRTAEEQIVVSDPISVQKVNSVDPQLETFTFTDAVIPINATDVYIQVVFRGVLGSEADSVVVATKDISEPTYISVTNSTDYIGIEGQLYIKGAIDTDEGLKMLLDGYGNNNGEYDENYDPYALEGVLVGFSGASGYLVTQDSLQPMTSIRIAVLQDLEPGKNMEIFAIESSIGSIREYISGYGRVNQLDENGIPHIDGIDYYDDQSDVGPFRGMHHFKGLYVLQQRYDPDYDLPYDVSGLEIFSSPDPIAVNHILGGY